MRLNITRPLPSEIEQIWPAFDKERELTLQPPQSFGHIVEQWGSSMLLWVGKVDGHLAALFILGDMSYEPSGTPYSAWVTLYVVPEQRGRIGIQLCRTAIDYIRGQSFTVLYTGIRRDNMAARYLARRCGFTRCGILPGGANSTTIRADALLYALQIKET